jgi:cyclopropane fatty-acyl-phospholipid synthase-like methyltransferase
MKTIVYTAALAGLVLCLPPALTLAQQTVPAPRTPDVIWIATQDPVVAGMLKFANVTKNDVVYDLGCGDGKIVIAAARMGARGVGIDIDPERVKEAVANAKAAGVSDRVQIIQGDIFDPSVKIGDATVVTLYLLEWMNVKLLPRLKTELKPGTRIVSNTFTMGPAWPAERTMQVGNYQIYGWTVPKP